MSRNCWPSDQLHMFDSKVICIYTALFEIYVHKSFNIAVLPLHNGSQENEAPKPRALWILLVKKTLFYYAVGVAEEALVAEGIAPRVATSAE